MAVASLYRLLLNIFPMNRVLTSLEEKKPLIKSFKRVIVYEIIPQADTANEIIQDSIRNKFQTSCTALPFPPPSHHHHHHHYCVDNTDSLDSLCLCLCLCLSLSLSLSLYTHTHTHTHTHHRSLSAITLDKTSRQAFNVRTELIN